MHFDLTCLSDVRRDFFLVCVVIGTVVVAVDSEEFGIIITAVFDFDGGSSLMDSFTRWLDTAFFWCV